MRKDVFVIIQRKSFPAVFLLGLITCGIYTLYYIYQLTRDVNRMAGDDGYYTDPAAAVVFSVLTCGIYDWYWLYRQGGRIKSIADCNNIPCEETGYVYLLWSVVGSLICGVGNIVAHYLLVKNFNNLADAYNSHMYF